jgi:hypothetical protein
MSIIKEKILFKNQDTVLKFNLGIGNRLSGYQQEIDNLTEETKVDLINPVIDNEVRRFQYDYEVGGTINLVFEFSANGSSYYNAFTPNGARFSTNEITLSDKKVVSSFFIMDFFDTFDNNTQTKIFTIYNTKILNGEKSGSLPIPKYQLNILKINQFYNWYVPKSFIDIQTGSTAIGYVKFSFYSAKYGNVVLFNNKDITNQFSPERMYFKVKLNLTSMTWDFDYSGTNYPPNVVARQIPFTNAYAQKVNNAVNNFDNEQQNYPEGNTFDITDGTYITV